MSSVADRMEERRRAFKKGVDTEEARRKREDDAVQLRKAKKDEMMSKKRMVQEVDQENENCNVNVGANTEDMAQLSMRLRSAPDFDSRLEITTTIRRRLSVENCPPIQECIKAGVVPMMIEFLKDWSQPRLQFESAWVLTNVASGTQEETAVVVDAGALPLFVALLGSTEADVVEQAIWAIGNIAGDSTRLRDLTLSHNCVESLLRVLIAFENTIGIVRQAIWAVSNLFRGKPAPPIEYVDTALPVFARLLFIQDSASLVDTLWGFSYISDGGEDYVERIIQSGAGAKIVELLNSSNTNAAKPALRTMGNIAASKDSHTEFVLHSGTLQALPGLLKSSKRSIRKDAAWLVSNLTAGTSAQIALVVQSGVIPLCVDLAMEGSFEVRKEAAWTIANAAVGSSQGDAAILVRDQAIPALCSVLDAKQTDVVCAALDGLTSLLKHGSALNQEANPYCEILEECEGLSKIEDLQADDNEELYGKAVRILTDYFDAGEVETGEWETDGGAPTTGAAFDFCS